ncbi:hypothetical protein B0J12DRAFT_295688 [Macrophomina phaseolina]|uniref:Uncharacterized protein n=1 Tax=Macrophomina phaseolina TaxID=35725 RepID=A0ABQ8GNW2_9PEZI|nr:hypothetical protein B0J12DRAFT_295688 [Macrophomina phaseolina]
MSSRPLESREAVLGRVLWLPPFDQLPANSVESVGQTPSIMREAFDHPIVICSRPAERNGEWVHFHIVTSFHNKSLAERFNMSVKKQRKQVNWYLPIAPSQYHPHETESPFGRPHIELDSGRTMSSNSFINAKDVYAIQWRFLTRYQRGSYRLTASSIDGMNERTGRLVVYHPGPQYVPEGVSEPSSPEPSPPLRPSYVVPNVIPPVDQLPLSTGGPESMWWLHSTWLGATKLSFLLVPSHLIIAVAARLCALFRSKVCSNPGCSRSLGLRRQYFRPWQFYSRLSANWFEVH